MANDGRSFPSPDDDDWTIVDDHMTGEDFEEAVIQLYERGLVDLTIDEHGTVWLRATETGIAAFLIEEAIGHLDDDAADMDDLDELP